MYTKGQTYPSKHHSSGTTLGHHRRRDPARSVHNRRGRRRVAELAGRERAADHSTRGEECFHSRGQLSAEHRRISRDRVITKTALQQIDMTKDMPEGQGRLVRMGFQGYAPYSASGIATSRLRTIQSGLPTPASCQAKKGSCASERISIGYWYLQKVEFTHPTHVQNSVLAALSSRKRRGYSCVISTRSGRPVAYRRKGHQKIDARCALVSQKEMGFVVPLVWFAMCLSRSRSLERLPESTWL